MREEDIICPECGSPNLEMVGDPEYNDEWKCEDCNHIGGSAYGVPTSELKN